MGVKSLWSLLAPAGRSVMLETVEGKSMAIDSSIWIYQFQATMRDKEGRGLVNAHVLGFLRRICKLLYYGIKPVFVFDGGAPALKRMTIAERKKKKSGAAESHERIAQRLLAAQMRKEALGHAQSNSKDVNKPPQGPVTIDEDTVYLEDLDASGPRTPAKNKGKAKDTPTCSAKKSRWHDHDPYRLPDVDMDAAVAKATRSTAPDPRLATEDELRTFIEMMRPEDLDVNSPAFRELPTEVQYEIIGDLRLKSRQTSHKRLQAMLRKSRTALDFSRAQIQNLKQRNSLTQQLLETTDSIGKANVTIPVRIASERNKEYVLVKNEDEIGGWVLGIRDDGTEDKPIVLDNADKHIESDQEGDDDMDMEEVAIPQEASADPVFAEYRRETALAAVAKCRVVAAARGRPKASTTTKKSPKKELLFIPDADESNADIGHDSNDEWEDVEDAELATAMQASLEDQEANDLRRAIEESRKANRDRDGQTSADLEGSDDDDLYVDFTPSRLDTALRFAYNAQDTKTSPPVMLRKPPARIPSPSPRMKEQAVVGVEDNDDDEDMEEIEVPSQPTFSFTSQPKAQEETIGRVSSSVSHKESQVADSTFPSTSVRNVKENIANESIPQKQTPGICPNETLLDSTKTGTEVKESWSRTSILHSPAVQFTNDTLINAPPILDSSGPSTVKRTDRDIPAAQPLSNIAGDMHGSEPASSSVQDDVESSTRRSAPESTTNSKSLSEQSDSESSSGDESWSRPGTLSGSKETQESTDHHSEGWNAALEMNAHEETGEFARFAAQVRGRDLDTVRAEIDDEIRQLHQQRKVAIRDSEDVNQAMVAQIMTMLRLFGIPYITAPMEAEAQCAALVELGLVDGVITDDSDVFLFGAKRVYKNMFNQSKTVECFLLTDLTRELGLDRGTLIRLAYLLGSDYVTGLPGVGPVVAMELLREFPGDDGLHKVKDWWSKVQSGRDKESDSASAFRKRFKKRFKELYLPSDWPNPAVRDAYYHPVVDTSEEPFKWGLPDLDGLRSFFHEELGWNIGKVDELLLPIIQRMNKRGQEAAANRQGTLNTFFNVSEGAGVAEPRRREAYASRRLQALVTAHRKAQKQKPKEQSDGSSKEEEEESDGEEEEERPAKKRRRKGDPGADNGPSRGRKGKVRGGSTRARRGRATNVQDVSHSEVPPEPKGKKTTKARSKVKGKSRRTANSGLDSSDEFVSTPTDAPVREIQLRKRIRPRPAYQNAIQDTNMETGNGGIEGMEDPGSSGSEYHG